MVAKQIVPGLYGMRLGIVNVFLLENDGKLALIDTGMPGQAEKILAAAQALGYRPEQVRDIVVTHCHADHAGSLAALKARTGARVWMHPLDAALVRQGVPGRPFKPAPGALPRLMMAFSRFFPQAIEPAEVDKEVEEGQVIPVAGGLQVFHAPGHCAGQIALRWTRQGGVLIAADIAGNSLGRLDLSLVYEDLEQGQRDLRRFAGMAFESACFGHGRPILTGADQAFRRRWGTSSRK